MMNLHAGMLIV